jgi:hypothetical protein
MLDLAIAVDHDRQMAAVVETNNGRSLKAPGWPQDSDFHLVAFGPTQNSCDVVTASELAADISKLLHILASRRIFRGRKPAWLKRLERYSEGAQANE